MYIKDNIFEGYLDSEKNYYDYGTASVSGNDVVELFHRNQVFEKMMIQYEYLHQISFEEAFCL